MELARDIFTVNQWGHEPQLDDLVLALDQKVASRLLGVAVPADEDELRAKIIGLSAAAKDNLYAKASLILSAATLGPDTVEQIVMAAGLGASANESVHGNLLRVIDALGPDDARILINDYLAAQAIPPKGKFTEHSAKKYAIDSIDPIEFAAEMEKKLEHRVATALKDNRRIKVRPKLVRVDTRTRLVCAVYFQRPPTQGVRVTEDRRLVVDSFARPYGSTYFTLDHGRGGATRVTMRDSTLARHIFPALGETLWKNPSAVKLTPLNAYDLSRFVDPNFQLAIARSYAGEIEEVTLVEVKLRTATGTKIVVAAGGRDQDALVDFRELSAGAPILSDGSTVDEVKVRFHLVEDRRRKVSVTLLPHAISLEEERWDLVREHLQLWKISMRD